MNKCVQTNIFRPLGNIHGCCFNSRCFSCLNPDQIKLDNCCQCNTAAFKKTTGISHDDIVYASFKNDVRWYFHFLSHDFTCMTYLVLVTTLMSYLVLVTTLHVIPRLGNHLACHSLLRFRDHFLSKLPDCHFALYTYNGL